MNTSKKLCFRPRKSEKKLKTFAQHLTPLWILSTPSNNESTPPLTTVKLPNDKLPELLSTFKTVFLAQTSNMMCSSSFRPMPLPLKQQLSVESSFERFFLSSPMNRRSLAVKMPLKYLVVSGTKTQINLMLHTAPDQTTMTISVTSVTSMATFSGTVPTTNAFNAARIADINPAPVKVRRNHSQSLPPPSKNMTQRNEKTNTNSKLPLLQSNTHIMLNLSNLFLNTTMNPSSLVKPKKNTWQSFLTANSIMKSPLWTSMRFPMPQRPFLIYFIKSALDIPIAPKLATLRLLAVAPNLL